MSKRQRRLRLGSIPSCGLSLLKGPIGSFDYVLRITSDDVHYVRINCHRCVLTSHSTRLRALIRDVNFFDMEIKVEHGYLSAAIELIQYMYLKDISLITERPKVLQLCALFEMPLDHFLLRNNHLEALNAYRVVHITVAADDSTFVTAVEFLRTVQMENAKIAKIAEEKKAVVVSRSDREVQTDEVHHEAPPANVAAAAATVVISQPKRSSRKRRKPQK